MQKTGRILSVFLCVTLLLLSLLVPPVIAETAQGRIITQEDPAQIRENADSKSKSLGSVPKGGIVTINGKANGNEAVSGGGTVWYNITYGGITGYVYGKYIEEIEPAAYNADFENNLLNFPESYRESLRAIHNAYPNWTFVADKIGITLDEAINLEYSESNLFSTRKWVELTYGIEWRDSRVDTNNSEHIKESRWTYASRAAIAYFMDPRNALTQTNSKSSFPNIFTFLQLSYNADTQTEAGLRTVIAGTFLENGYGGDKDAYVKDIMEAAKQSGVSPYMIASTIIGEQGDGTSNLISGTYTGYEGYYNFFNVGAAGDNVIVTGLAYAKEQNWDSRTASIIGGAKFYESGYLSQNQDTYYYMDFNIKRTDKIYHQYAQSVYDQCVKAAYLKKDFISKADAALTFKIPVYYSMPDAVYAAPTIENYSSGNGGSNVSAVTRKKGDVSGDGSITVKDFAAMRMHLLGVKTLNGEDLAAADVNSDGSVNVKDFAMVRMYLLGLISI